MTKKSETRKALDRIFSMLGMASIDESLEADYKAVKTALEENELELDGLRTMLVSYQKENQELKAEIESGKTIDCNECEYYQNNYCTYFDSNDGKAYDCSVYHKQNNLKLKAEITRLFKDSEAEIKELNEQAISQEQKITRLKDSLAHLTLDIEALSKENRHLQQLLNT